MTVDGVAFTHDDVAVWLDSLAKQKGYVNPYFSKSAEEFIGPRKVAKFTTTVALTPDVLSGRYAKKPAGS